MESVKKCNYCGDSLPLTERKVVDRVVWSTSGGAPYKRAGLSKLGQQEWVNTGQQIEVVRCRACNRDVAIN